MTSAPRHPSTLLPLKHDVFHILLVLLEGDAHGYRILKESRRQAGRTGELQAGTLYRLLRQMLDLGLVEEVDAPPREAADERRRFYRITPFGRAVVRTEGKRLAGVLGIMRRHRLLRDEEPG
jgi:DNA-binding PadR family transcriptional regulator